MKVFKFVTADVVDVVASGSVRLTTAEVIRRTYDRPAGRGDPNELTSRASIQNGRATIGPHHFANVFFQIIDGNPVPTGMDVIGESMAVVHDALLYCVTLEDTPEIRARMREDFGAEAVFEIADINEFAGVLSKHTDLCFRELTRGEVRYTELSTANSVAELRPVDPLVKDLEFSWQREYRLIWGGTPLDRPMTVEMPELARLLKRVG